MSEDSPRMCFDYLAEVTILINRLINMSGRLLSYAWNGYLRGNVGIYLARSGSGPCDRAEVVAAYPRELRGAEEQIPITER